LGDFKSELPPGVHIKFFACAGPKAYALQTSEDVEVFKAKGVTISHANKDIFQLKNLEKMIRDPSTVHHILSPYKIFRTRFSWTLSSRPQTKLFRYTFCKRKLLPSFKTEPYGYIKV
jgi:hypothetical protein